MVNDVPMEPRHHIKCYDRLQSLGLKSDLFIASFESRIEDKGQYIVVETNSNPEYFWGNFLSFKRPPEEYDAITWPQLFALEFNHEPLVKHCALTWDSPTASRGSADLFESNGFLVEESIVLAASIVHEPFHKNHEVVIRTMNSNDDWQKALENQIASRNLIFEPTSYASFKRRQMENFRTIVKMGRGLWYGAFLQNELVAGLGIFVDSGMARYQAIATSPSFRRRGIGASLVYEAAIDAAAKWEIERFVIVTESNNPALKIYKSVGFRPIQRQVGMCRRPSSALSIL